MPFLAWYPLCLWTRTPQGTFACKDEVTCLPWRGISVIKPALSIREYRCAHNSHLHAPTHNFHLSAPTHVHTYTHKHTHTHTLTQTYIHTHKHIYTHSHTHKHTPSHTHTTQVGTGLGPTLEFYTLLSHDLQRRSLVCMCVRVRMRVCMSKSTSAPVQAQAMLRFVC